LEKSRAQKNRTRFYQRAQEKNKHSISLKAVYSITFLVDTAIIYYQFTPCQRALVCSLGGDLNKHCE
jgi:hypothetical protein